jgi:L,D-peptidoglycan transpeptidase YkuD (ErfK/YbiS/YcfS/YnhG family)
VRSTPPERARGLRSGSLPDRASREPAPSAVRRVARGTIGLAALLVVTCGPTVSGALARPAPGGNGRFEIPADADQLVVVSSPTYDPTEHIATLRAFQRARAAARWRAVFGPWPAETGYGHLRDARRERDGSTPTGVFGVGATVYGIRPAPGGLRYRYHRLVCGDWWDEDPYSARYNHLVHVPCALTPPFASWSEALWTGTAAYPYFAVIRFNMGPVVGGRSAPGSGIFLHSWVGGATAGCVAVPEARLLALLRWLKPSAHPVVEIGTDREVEPTRLPSPATRYHQPP